MTQRLRIIQGAALPAQLRALVLARGSDTPLRVSVIDEATGAMMPCHSAVAAPQGTLFAAALAARKVRALHVVAQGLTEDTCYTIRATSSFGTTAVRTRTLPRGLPRQGITVAVASCYYDGYHRDAALATALTTPRDGRVPAFHIWAGDNLYMDVPVFSGDNAPVSQTLDRHLHYFLDSEYALLRGLAPALTTYDDHEYWNNYPQWSPWLTRSSGDEWKGYRDAGKAATELFQSKLNPHSDGPGYYALKLPPLEIFVLDTRTFRSRNGVEPKRLVNPDAIAAFKTWIGELKGPGVLVLGQPMWIAEGDWRDHNLPHYPAEYAALWEGLRAAPYDMLVVSGDVHHSRMLKIAFHGVPNRLVYEFVASPACHIPKPLSSSQDQGDVNDFPSRLQVGSQRLDAQAYFGTSVQQCVGLLRFVPLPNEEVRVDASFIDSYPSRRFATAETIKRVGPLGKFQVCDQMDLFTLRKRP